MMVIQGIGIEHTDSFIGFTLRTHRDEGKAIGLATLLILDKLDGCNIPGSGE